MLKFTAAFIVCIITLCADSVLGRQRLLIQTSADAINSSECGLCKIAWDSSTLNYDNREDRIRMVESLYGTDC